MINNTTVFCSIPEITLNDLECHYLVIDEAIHLFISSEHEVPAFIGHLVGIEKYSKVQCQFFNCKLYNIGSEFDEYLVEEAYLGEDSNSYKSNSYNEVFFNLSKDVLLFFDSPWVSSGDNKVRKLEFKTKLNRITNIEFNNDTIFSIELGYRQSYSKINYEAHSSVSFQIKFKIPASREPIFQLLNSIVDFYSLFFQKHLDITEIKFLTAANIKVLYKSTKTKIDSHGSNNRNILIESGKIKEKVESLIVNWIKNYQKNKISLSLIKDAQDVFDDQLKFICLSRCLEIFHKENFINNDKPPTSLFLSDLHIFLIKENLSNTSLKDFDKKKITLSHRIYDLMREVYDVIKAKEHRLIFDKIVTMNMGQKLADTRNYYIHFTDTKKKNAWKLNELNFVNYQLSVFIRVLFMKQFDFTNSTIEMVINKEKQYLFTK